MLKEQYIFLGAALSALVAFLVARFTSGIQLKIAKENSEKDIRLQSERLFDERLKAEISLEREKLEKLHKILSVISFENSQTMSYIQSSDTEIKEFRIRYIDNCGRLHDAAAISALYYPEMSESIKVIYGQSNTFWGHQEDIIRIDINENKQGWDSNLSIVLGAGKVINKHVKELQDKISKRGLELNKAIKGDR